MKLELTLEHYWRKLNLKNSYAVPRCMRERYFIFFCMIIAWWIIEWLWWVHCRKILIYLLSCLILCNSIFRQSSKYVQYRGSAVEWIWHEILSAMVNNIKIKKTRMTAATLGALLIIHSFICYDFSTISSGLLHLKWIASANMYSQFHFKPLCHDPLSSTTPNICTAYQCPAMIVYMCVCDVCVWLCSGASSCHVWIQVDICVSVSHSYMATIFFSIQFNSLRTTHAVILPVGAQTHKNYYSSESM